MERGILRSSTVVVSMDNVRLVHLEVQEDNLLEV